MTEVCPQSTKTRSIASNVLANGLWYVLITLSGFIIPRLIADYEGAESLGAWDLGWSCLFFVGFLRFGVTGTVNHYVSRYRVTADWPALNSVMSCATFLLSLSACVGTVVLFWISSGLHTVMAGSSVEIVASGRSTLLLLGFSATLQLPLAVYGSMLSGYERFDLLNYVRGGRDCAALVGMVVCLIMQQGIVALALCVLSAEILGGIALIIVARGLCPQLHISLSRINTDVMKRVLAFGGKSFVGAMSRSVLYQVNGIIVAYFMGPVSLAIYTRQRNLVMHLMRAVKQYAQVFSPISGRLSAVGTKAQQQDLLVRSAKWGFYLTLPCIGILVFLGGPIMTVWMGPEFKAPLVLTVLAIGHLLSLAQMGTYSVLEGMGRHGFPALLELSVAVGGIFLTFVSVGIMDWGMFGAALALALAVTIGPGLLTPLFACRLIGLKYIDYLRLSMLKPLSAVSPLGVWLVCCYMIFHGQSLWMLVIGLGVGGVITVGVYWQWVIPVNYKNRCVNGLRTYISSSFALLKKVRVRSNGLR